MSEGQRKARYCQRWLSLIAVLAMVPTRWFTEPSVTWDAAKGVIFFTMFAAVIVIDAMRALASEQYP